jgi:hypothetical protein
MSARDDILAQVAAGSLPIGDASKLLDALEPIRTNNNRLWCKVSPKGGLSVYGINAKWPVTLYVEQWVRLLAFVPEIQGFLKLHDKEFARKPLTRTVVEKPEPVKA